MSVVIYPWSKPGKESPAGPEFGDCCGLRPILLRWPRKIYIGVICRNPGCINSQRGVLACDVDIVEKWEHYRMKTEELKPCPFCGENVLRIDPIQRVNARPKWSAYAICLTCHAVGPAVATDESKEKAWQLAAEAWNRREPKTPQVGACGEGDRG